MSIGPIPLKRWRDFLKFHGLDFVSTKGGHEKWNRLERPFKRPVMFSCHSKDIPVKIISTNLRTMGLEMKDLTNFLK